MGIGTNRLSVDTPCVDVGMGPSLDSRRVLPVAYTRTRHTHSCGHTCEYVYTCVCVRGASPRTSRPTRGPLSTQESRGRRSSLTDLSPQLRCNDRRGRNIEDISRVWTTYGPTHTPETGSDRNSASVRNENIVTTGAGQSRRLLLFSFTTTPRYKVDFYIDNLFL